MRKKLVTSIVCSFLVFNLTNTTILTANAADFAPKSFNSVDTIDYYIRGINNYLSGLYTEAIKDFDKVIEINPNYVDAYYNRGFAMYKLGQHFEAIKDFDKAIELDPNFADAYKAKETAKHKIMNK